MAKPGDFILVPAGCENCMTLAARISALEAENARLRKAISDIRGYCKNDGLPNEMVLDRVIERIEEAADDALGDVPHD